MLLRIITMKKIPKNNDVDKKVYKNSSKDSRKGNENEKISSHDMHINENRVSTMNKWKHMDNLDGEFKKIKL